VLVPEAHGVDKTDETFDRNPSVAMVERRELTALVAMFCPPGHRENQAWGCGGHPTTLDEKVVSDGHQKVLDPLGVLRVRAHVAVARGNFVLGIKVMFCGEFG
jgi:hypothetical protein